MLIFAYYRGGEKERIQISQMESNKSILKPATKWCILFRFFNILGVPIYLKVALCYRAILYLNFPVKYAIKIFS